MSTLTLALGGGLVGAGVCAAAYGIRRPRLVERLTPRPAPAPPTSAGQGWSHRAGNSAGRLLAHVGIPGPRMAGVLTAAGRSVEAYRAEKAAATGLGLLLGTLLATVGTWVLPGSPMVWLFAATLVVTCFVAPDLAARSAAAEHQADLRAASSALADLTVMGLAAGAGPTGAVTAALQHGHGPALVRIREAVHAANIRHRPAWEGLEELCAQTRVRELGELAASLRLGGTSGARTRTSLTAKAQSLRARRLAEAEAAAHAATERMTLPTTGLVAGFLVLISYAALSHITTGF